MFNRLKKSVLAALIPALLLTPAVGVRADLSDNLPDMGTTAGCTLSIGQEMQMGDYYVRQLRGSAPLINDPLLVQYINALGMRLVAHADSVRTPFHFFLDSITTKSTPSPSLAAMWCCTRRCSVIPTTKASWPR